MTQMQKLKRSGASVTASPPKLFLKASVKLTALYVAIIAVIVIGFSLFLYESAIINFAEIYELDEQAQRIVHQRAFDSAAHRLQNTLVFSDIAIILASAGVGYFLAKRTLRPVEESYEAQRLFAANASHELRTPLAVMKNEIEVLLRDTHSERAQVQRTLSSNLEEIENMSSLIQNLLLLARSGQVQDGRGNSNIETVVQQTLEKMRPIADEKDIKLVKEFLDVGTVSVSEKILARALINIIENSLKYTPSGGSILVRAIKENTHARIDIIDTGEGIPAEELPHIFDRFYRGKSNSSDTGTGLGLALVRESIEQWNGSVSVQSELGKGTTVTITIPLA